MKLGIKLKQLRVERRITLKELSRQVGLTISFLSQLERDLVSPSIGSLEKIAQAFNVRIADLFREGSHKELTIVKKASGRLEGEKRHGVSVETLVSGAFSVNMQSHLFILASGAEITKEMMSPPKGEKFIMALKGSVKLSTADEKLDFEEGDSMYCTHTAGPDKIENLSGAEARVLYISFSSD